MQKNFLACILFPRFLKYQATVPMRDPFALTNDRKIA